MARARIVRSEQLKGKRSEEEGMVGRERERERQEKVCVWVRVRVREIKCIIKVYLEKDIDKKLPKR